MDSLGQRIAAVRKRAGLRQIDVARDAGICPQYLCHVECGKNIPSKRLTYLLAAKLNVCEHWLLTGEGEMYVTPQPVVTVPSLSPVPARPVLAKTTWRYRALEWLCHLAGCRLVVPTTPDKEGANE